MTGQRHDAAASDAPEELPAVEMAPGGPRPQTDLESARWWASVAERHPVLQRCTACGRLRFPPVGSCPFCAHVGADEVPVPRHGTVYSRVTAHVAVSPGYAGPLPYTVATVELAEGVRILARTTTPEVAVGQRVALAVADHGGWSELCCAPTDAPGAAAPEPPVRVTAQGSPSAHPGARGSWRVNPPRAAACGVGYSDLTRDSGRSVLAIASEAVRAAVDDAGLSLADVDGMASFMVGDDSVPCVAVASALAMGPQRWALDLNLGGQAPCHLVWQAAQAVGRGDAEVVVVYRALNGRSGARVGSMHFPGMGGQYRYPIGYGAYMMYVGMWGRRFLHETGQGEEDLAAVAIAQRRHAEGNDRAVRRQPLDLDAYLAEPLVVDPFRRSDCTVEVDGACAVVVTSLERARDLRRPPAVVASGCFRAGRRPGLDIGDHLGWEDYTRNYTSWLAPELFGRAGVGPADVGVAEIYDCFTSTVLMGLEGLGLCGRGESGHFVRSGATGLGGALPTNTGGGLLAEGYLHGMNTVAEAVLQVQGRCGGRQAPRHDVAVATSGALMDGSAILLTADR